MKESKPVSVLFTGYAPVHFLCFRSLYERLIELPNVTVHLSGGIRTGVEPEFIYDAPALYRPFHIPPEQILSVEAIQTRHFDVLFSANKRRLIPAENIGVSVQIFHGVSFRNRAIRSENLNYDVFFMIGPYMRQKFSEAGLLTQDDPRAVLIGFPKTDPLLNGKLNRAALLAQYELDDRRPVLLYAPTGEAHNSLETMGESVIRRLSATHKYNLLLKPHDHPKMKHIDWFARLACLENAHTRLVRDFDVIPLLFLADLLITDASSVANEYTLLNRPIVFLDVPHLLQESKANGALIDLETWGRRGGLIVKNPAEVEEAVAVGLAQADHLSEVRAAIAQHLFYHPGCATDAAMAWFRQQFLN
jgi:CDP-glycerol glycerophosphotransferase (TagB/SpsB family)